MRAAKLDLSPYLFHFIKGHVSNPMADLMSILREHKIYSRSRNNYICFTSSPITQVGQFFETQNHNTGKPLYQCYDLAFPRDLLINNFRACNVIYTDPMEQQFFFRPYILGDASPSTLLVPIGNGYENGAPQDKCSTSAPYPMTTLS